MTPVESLNRLRDIANTTDPAAEPYVAVSRNLIRDALFSVELSTERLKAQLRDRETALNVVSDQRDGARKAQLRDLGNTLEAVKIDRDERTRQRDDLARQLDKAQCSIRELLSAAEALGDVASACGALIELPGLPSVIERARKTLGGGA